MLHMIESIKTSIMLFNIAFYWIQTTSNRKNYYCDTCDKSFKTDEDLYLHEAEHETCGEEGCEFTAHPKIIERHIKMQHSTGLYRRIGNLYSKEEIDRWIQERKRRYPSRKAIEDKKALEEKKIERGERLKPDESRFNKSFTQNNRNDRKCNTRSVEQKPVRCKKERVKKAPVIVPKPTDENVDWRGSIPPFTGIGKPQKREATPESESEPEPEDAKNFSDDEWEELNTSMVPSAPSTPVINSSLNLLSCYNSDDESSDNNESSPEEVKTVTTKNNETEATEEASYKTNEAVTNENDKEASNKNETATNEIAETIRNDDDNNENLEVSHEKGRRKRRHNRNNKTKVDKKSKFKRRKNEFYETNVNLNNIQQKSVTLLEKLLSNEIRHERNVILQCVRYVVQNNFFQD